MLRATLIGSVAVLLWSTLALFTTLTGTIPPFQLLAMTFAIGALMALGKWLWRGEDIAAHLAQPAAAWAVGVGGLFGYHALYFVALRLVPAVEASLIAYLWPLLIVIFAAFLPGERLRAGHWLGALMGAAGAALILGRGAASGGGWSGDWSGYAAAGGCAVVWAGYSTLTRRFAAVPTDAVGGFCAVTAALGLACHLAFETTQWPAGGLEWLAVLALGLGPVGAAFFVWDHGCKHGDIKVLGTLSYAAPLMSTLLLVLAGRAEASANVALACLLIVAGAVLAGRASAAAGRPVSPDAS
ncbi:MAG: EamA family transporter [Thalassobaculales bacterium]